MVTRFMAAVVLAACFTACLPDMSDPEPSPTDSDTDKEPAAPTREAAMKAMPYLVFDNMTLLLNQNFVGQSAGAKELQTDCPLGGKVHFRGTTSVSDLAGNAGSNTGTDMRTALTGCGISGAKGNLTYTTPSTEPVEGSSIHHKGNWTTQFGVITYQSLTISGTANITGNVTVNGQAVEVNEPGCQFSITNSLSGGYISGDKLSGGTWTYSGMMCGVQFNRTFTE